MLYYSYDPEDGIEFHDTAAEAERRAEKALDAAEFHAADSDWTWGENEEEISWGEVHGKVSYNDRELTPEEKAENPEWSFYRNPTLDSLSSQARLEFARQCFLAGCGAVGDGVTAEYAERRWEQSCLKMDLEKGGAQ